jgi:hypothetical protein
MINSVTVVTGDCWNLPMQCVLRGARGNAVFQSGDQLQAFVYQGVSTTPLFLPTVAWYTASGTQNGYDQGQVIVSATSAQGALLTPNGLYTVSVIWAPTTIPGAFSTIVRNKLLVEPVGAMV